MRINSVYPPRKGSRGRVMALHCSGAGSSQWIHLAEVLGGGFEVLAPEHFGNENTGPWTGERSFTLADEAVRTIALIDKCESKVHLVGHSYGGGVALHVALARPERIASLALYEPSAFHLLRQMGSNAAEAFAEITSIARRTCQGVVTGDYRGAASAFVNYWNGSGAWDALRPAVQQALIRWLPKAPLDFRALIEEPTPASAYRKLGFPVLILRGEHAPLPTCLIAQGLSHLLPVSRLLTVEGAGHMGPLTHAPQVSALFVQHIASVETESNASRPRRWRPRCLANLPGAASRTAQVVS
jgi:pimeloyl-ACP methyl ester carboxylesterase